MSLLDRRREAVKEQAPPVSKFEWFRCTMCGHRESQLKTVSEVMHLCPKTKTMRTMKREET